jgi:hypothetical protein
MAELIEHGVSRPMGRLAAVDQAAAAVHRMGHLDRRAARAHVERHFAACRVVDEYLDL